MILIPWSVIPDPNLLIPDPIPLIPYPTYLVTTLTDGRYDQMQQNIM